MTVQGSGTGVIVQAPIPKSVISRGATVVAAPKKKAEKEFGTALMSSVSNRNTGWVGPRKEFASHSVMKPGEGGLHEPLRRAKELPPPRKGGLLLDLIPRRQGGNCPVPVVSSIGAFAPAVRSKVTSDQVTKKELKVKVSGSYVNDPDVGRVPDPVKLILYVVESAKSAMATGAPKAAIRSTLILNWWRSMVWPPVRIPILATAG
jgi:hypothetical protein